MSLVTLDLHPELNSCTNFSLTTALRSPRSLALAIWCRLAELLIHNLISLECSTPQRTKLERCVRVVDGIRDLAPMHAPTDSRWPADTLTRRMDARDQPASVLFQRSGCQSEFGRSKADKRSIQNAQVSAFPRFQATSFMD
jgi:hypothetical protein